MRVRQELRRRFMSIGSVINNHVGRLPVITPKPLPTGKGAVGTGSTTPIGTVGPVDTGTTPVTTAGQGAVGIGSTTPIGSTGSVTDSGTGAVGTGSTPPIGTTGGTPQASAPVSPVSSQMMSVLLSTQNDPDETEAAAATPAQSAQAITLNQVANGQGTTIGGSAATQAAHHHHHRAGSISGAQNDSNSADVSDPADQTDAFGASTDSASGSDTMSTLASVLDTLQGAATIAALA
jgi:hypothetical protein